MFSTIATVFSDMDDGTTRALQQMQKDTEVVCAATLVNVAYEWDQTYDCCNYVLELRIWRTEKSAAAMDVRDVLQHENAVVVYDSEWGVATVFLDIGDGKQECCNICNRDIHAAVATVYLDMEDGNMGALVQRTQSCAAVATVFLDMEMENESIATDMEEDVLYGLGAATGQKYYNQSGCCTMYSSPTTDRRCNRMVA